MTEQTQENQAQAPVAEKAPDTRTRREKLLDKYNAKKATYEKLAGELQELADEINGIDLAANINVGSEVTIKIGKGPTRKAVDGLVIGLRDEEDGSRTYKFSYGSAMDADVAVVKTGITVRQPAAQAQA